MIVAPPPGRSVRVPPDPNRDEPRMDRLAELNMAEQHVKLGERVVREQRLIVERLRRGRLSTATAEALLDRFELCLSSFRHHLAEVLQEVEDEGGPSSAAPCHPSNAGPERARDIDEGQADFGPQDKRPGAG